MQIKDRGSGDWVDESDIAALQAVFGSVKVDFALDDIRASEYHWFTGGATEMQVGVPGKAYAGSLHLQFGRGDNVNVKPNPVQQSIGGRKSGTLRTIQISPEVEARRHG